MQKVIQNITSHKQIILSYSAIFIILLFLIPFPQHGGYDRLCWTTWANFIFGNGLENIYKFDVDYLPLYHYVLYFYGLIQGSSEKIVSNINQLKYVTLLFEVVSIYFVYLLILPKYKTQFTAFFATLFILLNISFLYDNFLYGQVDGIYTAMAFISIFFAINKRVGLSLLFIVIAINFKLQAIVFLVLVGLILIPEIIKNFTFSNLIFWVLPSLIFQVLVILPFVVSGDFSTLVYVIKSSMGRYPKVSMGAYNIWYLIFDAPYEINDKQGVFGRSYHKYGLLLFFVTSGIALLPLIQNAFNAILKRKVKEVSVAYILLVATIIPFVFFFFNTQMHSRYVHSSVLMGGAYALYTKRAWSYVLLSVAYFFNIEGGIKMLKGDINEYKTLLFQPKFVVFVFLIALLRLFYELFYKKYLSSERKQ